MKRVKTDKKTQETEWKFYTDLPSGKKVYVQIQQTTETVARKCKVEVGTRLVNGKLLPVYTNMRDEKGEFITSPVPIPGLRLSIVFNDGKGTILEARSCCKPPDVFNAQIARKKALARIFLQDSGIDPANVKYEEVKDGDKTIRRKVREVGNQPQLNGEDRRALYYAVIRNGKLRTKPAKEALKKEKVG